MSIPLCLHIGTNLKEIILGVLLACLFGLSEPDLMTLLMMVDVVGKRGNGIKIR
jgi:hypothetical protein